MDAFKSEKLIELDQAIAQAIADKQTPGAVIWVEHNSQAYWKAYGNRALVPQVESMTRDTIFDVSSISKILSSATAAMMLIERVDTTLDTPIHLFLPHFRQPNKERITVRHLLTHTSGLPGELSIHPRWRGGEAALCLVSNAALLFKPGTDFKYSDLNFLILGEFIKNVSGHPLHEFCAREIYRPLGMMDTGFLPAPSVNARIAPTEISSDGLLRGVVHDPTARYMGGVSGHAGVFTTARDLAQYARMILRLGELDDVRILQPATVKLMTSVQTPPHVADRRGFGWDIDSRFSSPRGDKFPLGSFGHSGFTGVAIWIDPSSNTFFILLTNRVHPHARQNLVKLYRKIGTLAAESIES